MSAILVFNKKIQLATLWKMELQHYGKITCNFQEKVLAKNTRANQIISEAGDNINNDIACAKFKGLTPSQIVIAKILARNVALSEAILQKLSK